MGPLLGAMEAASINSSNLLPPKELEASPTPAFSRPQPNGGTSPSLPSAQHYAPGASSNGTGALNPTAGQDLNDFAHGRDGNTDFDRLNRRSFPPAATPSQSQSRGGRPYPSAHDTGHMGSPMSGSPGQFYSKTVTMATPTPTSRIAPPEPVGPDPARVQQALELQNQKLRSQMQEINDLRVNIPQTAQPHHDHRSLPETKIQLYVTDGLTMNLKHLALKLHLFVQTSTLRTPLARTQTTPGALGSLTASLSRSEELSMRLADTASSLAVSTPTATTSRGGVNLASTPMFSSQRPRQVDVQIFHSCCDVANKCLHTTLNINLV